MIAKQVGKTLGKGVLATGAMSLFMLAAERAGALGRSPPHKLTRRFLRLWSAAPRPASVQGATGLSHFGFGAAAALPFRALASRLPNRLARITVGTLYGAAIWAVMYQGVLPALRLMPKPRRDRPGRPASMFLAHVIYGGVLGASSSHQPGRDQPEQDQAIAAERGLAGHAAT